MTTLMKATQPHWLGNKFVPVGTVLPEGHPEAIESCYEAYEIDDPADPAAERDAIVAELEAGGVRVDKRWGDQRLSDERDALRLRVAEAEAKAVEAEEEASAEEE